MGEKLSYALHNNLGYNFRRHVSLERLALKTINNAYIIPGHLEAFWCSFSSTLYAEEGRQGESE